MLVVPEGDGKKKRLFRRDSDDPTSRCIKLRLGMFCQSQIDNNIFEGKHIHEAVKAKFKECKTLKRHIPLSYWVGLIREFKLKGSLTRIEAT